MLEAQLRASVTELAEIRAEIGRVNAEISDVERRTHDLSAGRQLYDFFSRRAADYRAQQGLVGMLHRDFRLLDAKLRRLAAEADSDGTSASNDAEALKPIRRVVLYIDLDRCPPEKVLQAVHLLLTLELFIVVVGGRPALAEPEPAPRVTAPRGLRLRRRGRR